MLNYQIMTTSNIYIKNMCCDRCIEVVRKLLTKAGYNPVSVSIGEVVIPDELSKQDLQTIKLQLKDKGFDVVNKSDEKTVIQIHSLLCNYLDEILSETGMHKKLSVYLSENLHRSYYNLSRVFSNTTGITIEKYFICLKIEKAKELIILGELNVSEIAWKLGYGSQQTFNTLFRKETGKTPREYKIDPQPARIHLDKLLPQNFKQYSYENEHLKD